MSLQSLKSRSDAREWAEFIIARVAVGQGWTQSMQDLAAQVVLAAWDQTPLVSDPFWGLLSDTGPEFFAAMVVNWKTADTFPESWNNLLPVWIAAQDAAQAQDDEYSQYYDLVVDAVVETGEDIREVATFGIGAAGLGLGLGLVAVLVMS